jgi:hypothetical protein
MKCAFLGTKIAASFETAKRILLKSVKGDEVMSYPNHQPPLGGTGFWPRARLTSCLPKFFLYPAMNRGNVWYVTIR